MNDLSRLADMAEILGALVVVGGLIFAIMQMRNIRQQRRELAAIELFRFFGNPDFNRAYERILKLPDGLTTEEIEIRQLGLEKCAMQISTTMENIGVMTHQRIVPYIVVKNLMGASAVILWKKLEHWVYDLREEVGNDAARFFYVMRSNDQHLDFDLDLAKSHREENPVYYVQYAHARICQMLQKLPEQSLRFDEARARASIGRLVQDKELALIKTLARYAEQVTIAARDRAPQTIVHYLRDVAAGLHSFYNDPNCRVIIDDDELRDARVALITATRQILQNGLALLGVSAPERM